VSGLTALAAGVLAGAVLARAALRATALASVPLVAAALPGFLARCAEIRDARGLLAALTS
jgi:hypothetical protein